MASELYGPTDRLPNYDNGEWQWCKSVGAQTITPVPAGGGVLHSVLCGVAGTLVKFYDVAAGGTTDATTEIATVSLTELDEHLIDAIFSRGLTAIITGAAAEITISFSGRSILNTKVAP